MRMTAISFDADQTLWDFRAVQRKALAATVDAMVRRGDVPPGTVDSAVLQIARDRVAEENRGRPHSLEAVRQRSFEVVLAGAGHPDPTTAAAELTEIYLTVRFDQIELYPDVASSISRLAVGHRLGLLSNGNTDPDRCGLPGTFDAVVLGPAHGVEKPDRRAFELIASGLEVDVSSLIHVGDDWDDVDGANDAGAISVFMNRDSRDPEFRSRAAHEVRDLVGLEHLLAGV